MQLLGCVGLIFLFSCSLKNDKIHAQETQGIRSIKVKQILPTLDSAGNVSSIDTSTVQIYYFQNKMLYKIETRYADQTTSDYSTLKIRYSYFSTSDSGKTGYYFASSDAQNTKFVSGNSVLGNEWFGIVDLNRLFVDNQFLLLKSEKDPDNGDVHEYYEFKDKIDTSFRRTAHLYFKNKKCDLYVKSTHTLDERKNMRLIKFQMHTPKQYSKEMKEFINEYSLTYLIEDVQLTQLEQDNVAFFLK